MSTSTQTVHLNELGKSLRSSSDLSEEDATRLLTGFVETLRGALVSGKDVTIAGFGSFSLQTADGKPLPSMYKSNLVSDISSRLGESNEAKVQALVNSLVETVKVELLAGRQIALDDLGSFHVAYQRPEIEKQAKGHRLIRPAVSTLSFSSEKTFSTPSGESKLAFTPSDDLRKRIEQYKASSILLVVPEQDYFVKTLEYYFQNSGWDIEAITSIPDAVKRIESGKAYLVILDAGFPDHQTFCLSLKMHRETSTVPIIMLYPNENSWKVFKEVSIVGDENLSQPFEFRALLDLADNAILQSAEEELIFLQQVNLHLPTEEQSIEKVIEVTHKLLEMSGIGEEGQVAMSAAFREAVVNAAQHGNKYKREKKIQVQYLLDAQKITLVVQDNGPGFNHEKFVKSGNSRDAISAARERHNEGRMGGLGIMLMLRCCDRLEYNQEGNQIALTKYLKPPPEA